MRVLLLLIYLHDCEHRTFVGRLRTENLRNGAAFSEFLPLLKVHLQHTEQTFLNVDGPFRIVCFVVDIPNVAADVPSKTHFLITLDLYHYYRQYLFLLSIS